MTTRVMGWSGPRNISTAMMRAWENRPDCEVWDEPFYAAWLLESGERHPGRAATLARHESDRATVAAACAGPGPEGKAIFYQKQMAHHAPEGADLGFARGARHFHLIRDPRRVAASYARRHDGASAALLGFERQAALVAELDRLTGTRWPVIDAETVLENPRAALTALCRAIGVPFDDAMLAWPPGRRGADGAWAPYWYDAVEASTGFAPPSPPPGRLPDPLERLAAEGRPAYEALRARALAL